MGTSGENYRRCSRVCSCGDLNEGSDLTELAPVNSTLNATELANERRRRRRIQKALAFAEWLTLGIPFVALFVFFAFCACGVLGLLCMKRLEDGEAVFCFE